MEVEYFKSLRDEINIRIQEHTRLVWLKIVSLGVMIYFLIDKFYDINARTVNLEPPLLFLVYIIPLAALIFDFLIAGNLKVISNLGYYIKIYIENEAFVETKNKIDKKFKKRYMFETEKNGELKDFKNAKIYKILKEKLKSRGFKIYGFKIKSIVKKIKGIFKKDEGGDKEFFEKINGGYKIVDEKRVFIIEEKEGSLKFKHLDFGFWEEKAAQSHPKYRCYTLGDIVVIWLLTLVSGIFSISLVSQKGIKGSFEISMLVIGVFSALFQLIRSIKMERRF